MSSSTSAKILNLDDESGACCLDECEQVSLSLSKEAISKAIDDDEDINEELLKIQELDTSINDLELRMQEVSDELITLQIQNRDKLKQILSDSSPECGLLAKNTQNFFNLYGAIEKKIETQGQSVSTLEDRNLDRNVSLKVNENDCLQLEELNEDINDEQDELSLTDEEKQQLEVIMHDELNESNEQIQQKNPFSLDDESKKWLEDKIKSVGDLEPDIN